MKVRCIDHDGARAHIHVGGVYQAEQTEKYVGGYDIVCDDGTTATFMKDRFVPVDTPLTFSEDELITVMLALEVAANDIKTRFAPHTHKYYKYTSLRQIEKLRDKLTCEYTRGTPKRKEV